MSTSTTCTSSTPAHRTAEHQQLLSNLDPHNPLSVQALIDFHRTTFGGWTMNANGGGQGGDGGGQGGNGQGGQPGSGQNGGAGGGGQPNGGQPNGGQPNGGDGDEKLGEAGMNALKSEREARKGLEKQLADWKAEQKTRDDKLAEAFGIKKDAKSNDNTDVVAELQKQMAGLQHNNLVLTVAGEHKITDTDDLALLRETGSEESMRKLAKRLSGSATDDGGTGNGNSRKAGAGKGGTPRPDRTQGNGNNNQKKAGEDGLAEARKRWPKPANQQ